MPGAVLAGLIIGLSEAGAVQLVGAEWRAAVAFVILMAVLLIRPHRPVRSGGAMIDLLGYGAFFLSTALIFGLMALGLNLQWGLTGLFNVGIAGFVAIGAYTSAILTTPEARRPDRRLRLADPGRLAGGDGAGGAGRGADRLRDAAAEGRLSGDHHLRRRGGGPAGRAERAKG